MKFQKAEVELILFDNSDIVTKSHDLLEDDYWQTTCSTHGNSAMGNTAGRSCILGLIGWTCSASGDFYYDN